MKSDDINLDVGDPQRVADELLIHGMLIGNLHHAPEQSSARLARVQAAIEAQNETGRRTPGPSAKTRSRSWSIYRWVAGVVVCLAAGLGIWVFFVSGKPALAGVEAILKRLAIGDQTFSVELREESGGGNVPGFGPLRRPGSVQGDGSTLSGVHGGSDRGIAWWKRYNGAVLSVRGNCYVVDLKDDDGDRVDRAKGFDGKSIWYVGPRLSAITDGMSSFERPAPIDECFKGISVNLQEYLRGLTSGYEVAKATRIAATSETPEMVAYLATRRTTDDSKPSRIEIEADAANGQLFQLKCHGVRIGQDKRFEVTMTLISTDELPKDWFTERAHK